MLILCAMFQISSFAPLSRLLFVPLLCAALLIATPAAAADHKATKPAAKTATKAPAKPAVPSAAAAGTAAAAPTAKAATAESADPADNVDAGPKLPVPRFVTLSVDEINVRTGPGVRYPIKFIFRKDGLPVEIVHEYDVWRQIRDKDGDGGWVHKTMLSGRRSVIITGHTQTLVRKPDEAAKPVVKLEPGVIADLSTCRGDWCSLKIAGYNGWTKRANLWGVYPDEAFKE